MKVKVQSLDGGKAGKDIELSDEVFGVEPRADILHRVVTWQLEKRRGTARGARERSDVARTGTKLGRQKGAAAARTAPPPAPTGPPPGSARRAAAPPAEPASAPTSPAPARSSVARRAAAPPATAIARRRPPPAAARAPPPRPAPS